MTDDTVNIPFFLPHVSDEDIEAVCSVLKSRWLTGGPKAVEFEKQFAEYVGTRFAVSVNSGTAALHLSVLAAGVRPGDEVVVPVLTFAATANAPLFVGAKPVFADVDEKTFNISPESLKQKITDRTKAIIIVHYGGQPCDMKEILKIAADHELNLIEDCAHSLGARYDGKQTGSFGLTGCFSFYPTKNITTLEGGMITTDNTQIADKVRTLREHGMTKMAYQREKETSWFYDVIDLGYNYRLNEVQAALGISQLNRLDHMNLKKITNAEYLTRRLASIDGIIPPFQMKDRTHVYHLYPIRVVEQQFGIGRNQLFLELSRRGIGLSVHYTPLHLLTFYKNMFPQEHWHFPVSEMLYSQILTLPMYHQLSKDSMDYIVESIEQARFKA